MVKSMIDAAVRPEMFGDESVECTYSSAKSLKKVFERYVKHLKDAQTRANWLILERFFRLQGVEAPREGVVVGGCPICPADTRRTAN